MWLAQSDWGRMTGRMTGRGRVASLLRQLLLGGALTMLLGLPAAVMAGTGPESPLPSCALGTSTLVAGTPLELSGTISTNEAVGVLARRVDGASREGTVAVLNGAWHAVLLFGTADSGSWIVEIGADGANCTSALTVTLPPGVVAPPTLSPIPDQPQDTSVGGMDVPTLQAVAARTAVVLIVGSWLFVALIQIVRGFGRRPLVHPWIRRITRVATFLAILGAALGMWVVGYFFDAMRHFDSGIPASEQLLLDAGFWGAVIVGSVLGTMAALRVRDRSARIEEVSS